MLYIHSLKDLTPKSADIESTGLVRKIRAGSSFPVSEDALKEHFTLFFVSHMEIELMEKNAEMLPLLISDIMELLNKDDHDYERVSLQRTIALLETLPEALKRQITFSRRILEWQEVFPPQAAELLNAIPHLKSYEEKKVYNDKIDTFFERILRSKNFTFNANEIINEGHVASMATLSDSMKQGFFFHVKLDEYLKKQSYSSISKRLAQEEVARVDAIEKKINSVRDAVDKAYEINMRMIEWALLFYAYIKWAHAK